MSNINEYDTFEFPETNIGIPFDEHRGEKTELAELILPIDLVDKLNAETERRSRDRSGEFWVFLVGKEGEETISVSVGIGHSWGVSANPTDVVNQLRPYVEQGYRIVADYHNHPDETRSVYQRANFPDTFVVSPSMADLNCDKNSVRGMVISELNQKPYPRIIAAYSPEEGRVIVNAFSILREPIVAEANDIEFDDPNFTEDKPDELGIRMFASRYVDPPKLDKLGIVTLLAIKGVSADGSVIEIQNDLAHALSGFHRA